MIFYDTNTLVYFTIKTLDTKKHSISTNMITESIEKSNFLISPLVMSEFFHTLSKLKTSNDTIKTGIDFFKTYVKYVIDKDTVMKSINLAIQLDMRNHINDLIHLLTAEKYCDKLITFDKDFKRLIGKANIKIDIIES
jgi:predicted nucleic acid-binding protein